MDFCRTPSASRTGWLLGWGVGCVPCTRISVCAAFAFGSFGFKEFQGIDHDLRAVDLLAVLLIVIVLAPACDKELCALSAVLFNGLGKPVPTGTPEKISRVISLFIPLHAGVGNRKIEYRMADRFTACTVSNLGILCQPSYKIDLVHGNTCTLHGVLILSFDFLWSISRLQHKTFLFVVEIGMGAQNLIRPHL